MNEEAKVSKTPTCDLVAFTVGSSPDIQNVVPLHVAREIELSWRAAMERIDWNSKDSLLCRDERNDALKDASFWMLLACDLSHSLEEHEPGSHLIGEVERALARRTHNNGSSGGEAVR